MAKKANNNIKKAKRAIPPVNVNKPPKEVANKGGTTLKYWKEWADIDNKIKNHEHRFYIIEDVDGNDMELDLIQGWCIVGKYVKHLSEGEVEVIRKQWKEFRTLISEKRALRYKWDDIKKNRNKQGFYDIKKTEIIELLGRWKTVEETTRICNEEWGYPATVPKIREIRNANIEKIDKLRNDWVDSYQDFDIAKKRGRIERLAYLAKTQMDKYNNNNHRTEYSKEIRAILDQVKKEVEGDHLSIDINGNIDITQTVNMNMSIRDIAGKLNLQSMIIGQVAAKKGIDPQKIMNKLANSYYSSMNGFNGKPLQNKESMVYPSDIIYNWNEIEEKHKSNNIESESNFIEYEEVTEEQEETKRDILATLLEKKKATIHARKTKTTN